MNKKTLSESLQEVFLEFKKNKESKQEYTTSVVLNIEVKKLQQEMQDLEKKKQEVKENKIYSDEFKIEYNKNLDKLLETLNKQYDILKQDNKTPSLIDNTDFAVRELYKNIKEGNNDHFLSYITVEKNETTSRFLSIVIPFLEDKTNGHTFLFKDDNQNIINIAFKSNIDTFFKLNELMVKHHLHDDFSSQGRKFISFDTIFSLSFQDDNFKVEPMQIPFNSKMHRENTIYNTLNNSDLAIPFQYNFDKEVLIGYLYLALEDHFEKFNQNQTNIFQRANKYLENQVSSKKQKI